MCVNICFTVYIKSCTIITDVASVLQQQKMEGQEKKVEGDGGGGSGSLLWPQPASEDKSSSTDELQKSIRLATNVLDLPEEDGRCSGCCNYPKQDYGHPKIDLVNGTLKVMRLKRPNVMNLTGNYFMSEFPQLSFKLKDFW